MLKMKLLKLFPLAVLFSVSFAGSSDNEFSPVDNILIACGSSENVTYQGRTYFPDSRQYSFQLKSQGKSFVASTDSGVPSTIYKSARVFNTPASYEFDIRQKGRHWVRFYFYPFQDSVHDLQSASFTVATEEFVLLEDFAFKKYNRSHFSKEYVITVKSNNLTVTFIPSGNSVAFVNGIEVVSVPDELFSDHPLALSRSGPFIGLSNFALETMYRLNVGGPLLTAQNDTLGRTWENDHKYIHVGLNGSAIDVMVNPATIKYEGRITPQTAPNWVYASAVVMGDSPITLFFFNITWKFPVEPNFAYFVRLHFCDIISKSHDSIVFNVYINNEIAIYNLELGLTGGLALPYLQDLIIYNFSANFDALTVSTGPISIAGINNSTMNGIEIMKISNDVRSLDGFSSLQSLIAKRTSDKRKSGKTVGLAVGISVAVVLMLLGLSCSLMACRRKASQKR